MSLVAVCPSVEALPPSAGYGEVPQVRCPLVRGDVRCFLIACAMPGSNLPDSSGHRGRVQELLDGHGTGGALGLGIGAPYQERARAVRVQDYTVEQSARPGGFSSAGGSFLLFVFFRYSGCLLIEGGNQRTFPLVARATTRQPGNQTFDSIPLVAVVAEKSLATRKRSKIPRSRQPEILILEPRIVFLPEGVY